MSPRGRLAVNIGAVAGAAVAIAGLTAATVVSGHREPPTRSELVSGLTWTEDDLQALLPAQQELETLATPAREPDQAAIESFRTSTQGYELSTDVIPTSVRPATCTRLLFPAHRAETVLGGSASEFVDDQTYLRVTATANSYSSPAAAEAAFEALARDYRDCDAYTYRQILSPQTEYTWVHDSVLSDTDAGIPVIRVRSEMQYRIQDTDYRQLVTLAIYRIGDATVAYSVARFPGTSAAVPETEGADLEDRLDGAVLVALEQAESDG